jgi:hypothetical protein
MRIAGPSSIISAKEAFLEPTSAPSISMSTSFVHIQVEAYMFTLDLLAHVVSSLRKDKTYRSIQLPGTLTATLLQLNPHSPNTRRYHGSRPALLNITLPRTFNARFSARICLSACVPCGGNQSMLSMTTTIVKVPGRILEMTSEISSV